MCALYLLIYFVHASFEVLNENTSGQTRVLFLAFQP
jgi:hypothetical protein